LLNRSVAKRDSFVTYIRYIYDKRGGEYSGELNAPYYPLRAARLDSLWRKFESADLDVLHCLSSLNRTDEYSLALRVTVRELIDVAKIGMAQLCVTDSPDWAFAVKFPAYWPQRTSEDSAVNFVIAKSYQCSRYPSGQFSKVLSSCTSAIGGTELRGVPGVPRHTLM